MQPATGGSRAIAAFRPGMFLPVLLLLHGCYASDWRSRDADVTGPDADAFSDPSPDTDAEGASDTLTDGIPDIPEDEICLDRDLDGHRDPACGGDDCNDLDPMIFPGAAEVCGDGIDQDCDGVHDTPTYSGTPSIVDPALAADVAMAWTGSRFAVAWSESWPDEQRVYTSLFLDEDAPIEEDRMVGMDGWLHGMRLEWIDGQFGLAWYSWSLEGKVAVAILDDDGAGVRSVTTIGEPPMGEVLKTVWTGSEIGVAWLQWTSLPAFSDPFFAVIDVRGEITLGPVHVSDYWAGAALALAWTGSLYEVAWGYNWDSLGGASILMAYVDPSDGEVGPPVTVATPQDPYGSIALAWSGTDLGLLWIDQDPGRNLILMFDRLDGTGAGLGEAVAIDVSENPADGPTIDWIGDGWIVGWRRVGSYPGSEFNDILRFYRLDPAGARVAGTADLAAEHVERRVPYATAWSGSALGVAWNGIASGVPATMFATLPMCE